MSLVECPTCRIGFSAGAPRCPKCKTFEPPLLDRARYAATRAEADLEIGISPKRVRADLESLGLSELHVDELFAMCQSKVAVRTRRAAVPRLIMGVLMAAAGAAVVVAFLSVGFTVSKRNPLTWIVIIAVLVSIYGMFAFISGTLALVTGRESSVVAPKAVEEILFGDDQSNEEPA